MQHRTNYYYLFHTRKRRTFTTVYLYVCVCVSSLPYLLFNFRCVFFSFLPQLFLRFYSLAWRSIVKQKNISIIKIFLYFIRCTYKKKRAMNCWLKHVICFAEIQVCGFILLDSYLHRISCKQRPCIPTTARMMMYFRNTSSNVNTYIPMYK